MNPSETNGELPSDSTRKDQMPASLQDVSHILSTIFKDHPNFVVKTLEHPSGQQVGLFYMKIIVNSAMLSRELMEPIMSFSGEITYGDLLRRIPIGQVNQVQCINDITQAILLGWTYVHLDGETKGAVFNTSHPKHRQVSKPEIETQILGPQVAFTESMEMNSALIHSYIPDISLKEVSLKAGEKLSTPISLFYMEDLCDPDLVQTIQDKVESLNLKAVLDADILAQWIEDGPTSIFPQLLLTERVDRAIYPLLEGKAVLMVGGSPFAIICPSTFLDFFKSVEDSYYRWNTGSFLRLMRVLALLISLFGTSIYVAALTYHYETIPQAFLVPLAQSRARVPFPPLFEALLLELIIQLLSEAGARLPTKVGQTMGIVGGIVIGQAAVQAGFTSNILIIIVALGALSSFTTPVFQMANSIRSTRFPIIILAGILGAEGIAMGIVLLVLHLLRQTSMGHPYFYPMFAATGVDKRDGLLRSPYLLFPKKSIFVQKEGNSSKKPGGDIDD
ncbi:spore germination protein [Paenibacillus swuensis]|uniref:spore germination protein n=1 Tax=Paenibacillus swuensis TaxID=1178515 RepID=UPI0018D49898|nr:spore germination protein [Paenibacillus swuensis]